jgi:tetratricopeptide (TPR) repeat protein
VSARRTGAWGLALAIALAGAGCKGDPPATEPPSAATDPAVAAVSPNTSTAVVDLEPDDPPVEGAPELGAAAAAPDPMAPPAAPAWTPERDAEWKTELAQVHLRFGKHDEALALLTEALPGAAGTPAERRVQEALATTYRALGKPAEAAAAMEKAVAATPDELSKALLQQQLASYYADAGDTAKAEAALSQRLAAASTTWERGEVLRQIIALRHAAGTLDAWVAELEEKLDAAPQDVATLDALYLFNRRTEVGGTPKMAAEYGLRLVKLRGTDNELRRQVREDLRMAGKFDEALALARELADGPHEGTDAARRFEDRRQVAEVLLAKGDTKAAIAAFEQLAGGTDGDEWARREVRRRLFETYRAAGQLAEVVARYERELSGSKDRGKLELLLAAQEAADKPEAAVATLEKLRDAAPDDAEIARRLSQAWVQTGKWEKAAGELTAKLQKAAEPDKLPILRELAALHVAARKPDKAKAYFEELALRDPASKALYQSQIEMLESTGGAAAVPVTDPAGGPAGGAPMPAGAAPAPGGPPPMPAVPAPVGSPSAPLPGAPPRAP